MEISFPVLQFVILQQNDEYVTSDIDSCSYKVKLYYYYITAKRFPHVCFAANFAANFPNFVICEILQMLLFRKTSGWLLFYVASGIVTNDDNSSK